MAERGLCRRLTGWLIGRVVSAAIMIGLSAGVTYFVLNRTGGLNLVQSTLGGQMDLTKATAAIGPLLNPGPTLAPGGAADAPANASPAPAQMAALFGMLGGRGPAGVASGHASGMILLQQAAGTAAREQPAATGRGAVDEPVASPTNSRGYIRVRTKDPATGRERVEMRYIGERVP